MDKKILFSLILIIGLSCSNNSQNKFDYATALQHVKEDIEKSTLDSRAQAHLLSKIDLIIFEDSNYNKPVLLRDSLIQKYLSKEGKRPLINQLNINYLEDFTIQDRIEVYKFWYWRAFSQEIVEITIANQDSFCSLKTQIYRHDYNCEELDLIKEEGNRFACPKILINEQKIISMYEWNVFKSIIEKTSFWELQERDGRSGLDGSSWVIEGSKRHNTKADKPEQIYKAVYRWSPLDNDELKQIGTHLLKFSGKNYGKIY